VEIAEKQLAASKIGVTIANKNLNAASVSVKQAKDTAGKRTVTAPVGGVITVLTAQNGQSLSGGGGGSGSSASGASSVSGAAEISNLASLRARVQINEVDLISVKVGQSASVTFDALPDGETSGTVVAVSPTGTNTQGVITYDVDVTLVTLDPRLKPNMSCSLNIVTQTKENALTVPTSAIKLDSATNTKYVQVLTQQGVTDVKVQTGLVVGTETEILSGLTEGQTVTTSSTSTTGSGTSGTGGNRGGGGMGAMFGGGGPRD
jgi:multidrug efflux pump subunit AcrA (membrane-fusion protein)